MESLRIFTDGGCHGNPGPGAWAYRIVGVDGTVLAEDAGSEPHTTNNRMELTAVIRALAVATERWPGAALQVTTDSQYVRQGITAWILNWKRNGWRTASKTPVKNEDLWRILDSARDGARVEWHWVRGHSGDAHNEACDAAVQAAIRSLETR